MSKSVGDVEMLLEDYLNLLNITDVGDYIIIRVKKYLPKEEFSKLSATVRHNGGEYISQGKESHFRIPKGTTQEVKVAGILYCPHCGKPLRIEKGG